MREGIGVHHDSEYIAKHLEDDTAEHTTKEAPDAVSDAEANLGDEEKAEECGIEGVSR